MHFIDLISKKKNKQFLSKKEIDYIIQECIINKAIPDYQLSALLMAFRLNGMNEEEIYFLTKAFIDNSEKISVNKRKNRLIIDKHSSGGVGDKISMIIIPILSALGFDIVKISGRGLGHTGGTIDKLEGLGFISSLKNNEINSIFAKTGMILMEQTKRIVPADKVFYELRDVTSTIDTPGLIVASILAKKFIVNSDYIFLDLKVGSGALLKNLKEAKNLAYLMIKVANLFNKQLFIYLTNMDKPLGNSIGNLIEVKEAIDFLLGKNINLELFNLVKNFVIDILITTKKAKNKIEAREMFKSSLSSKNAYNQLLLWFENQGVNVNLIKQNNFFKPKYKLDVKAKSNGFLKIASTSDLGMLAVCLGVGRKEKQDQIDYHAGIFFHKSFGQEIKKNELVATIYASYPIEPKIELMFNKIIYCDKLPPKNGKMILSTLKTK